jgi:hypothetical protein
MTPDEQTEKLLNIFLPYTARCRERMIRENGRFVHYTSAANALSIIKSRRIWMRNTTCMSDYREVRHGLDALNRYFADPHNQAFSAALNSCHSGAADEALTLFNQQWQNTQLGTYITSISEHDNREDLHGRLSMWRAFGGGGGAARVALVFKLQFQFNVNISLQSNLIPVAYFTDQELKDELDAVVSKIQAERPFLSNLDRMTFITSVFHMYTAHVVCLKHEGFHEEKEWRIIYTPSRSPSRFIESATEIVSGLPQLVYKIPLQNNSSAAISGIAFADIFDRVIIGPSQFHWAMYEAFVAALDAAGIKDAARRVFPSQIPVRT